MFLSKNTGEAYWNSYRLLEKQLITKTKQPAKLKFCSQKPTAFALCLKRSLLHKNDSKGEIFLLGCKEKP